MRRLRVCRAARTCDPGDSMKLTAVRACIVLASLVLVAAAIADEPARARAVAAGQRAPDRAAGLRIHRNPVTGVLEAQPTADSVLPASSLGTSSEGLVETPGTSPAGGITVDLKGRFRSTVSATADATGRVKTGCAPGVAAGTE